MGLGIDASLSTQLLERLFYRTRARRSEARRVSAMIRSEFPAIRKFAAFRWDLREVLYEFDVFQE